MKKAIKKVLAKISEKNVTFRKIYRKLRTKRNSLMYKKYYKKYDVDDKLCVFEVFNGRKYCDSPKALYLEMLSNKKYKDYKFVWAFKNPENYKFLEKNKNTTVVKYNSNEYKKAYSQAKYWIVNSIISYGIIKKENQICVQCWHGTPLKKLRCDIQVNGAVLNTLSEIRDRNDKDAKYFDYFLSPSQFASEKFISAFDLKRLNKENIIVEKGYPRNDYLFKYTESDIKNIKKNLKIKTNKKIILYAPTWRDNQHEAGVGYTYKLGLDFDKLKENFEDEYIVLFRAHYFIANSFDFSKYKGFVYNVSDVEDINDLYIISDLLITDYSSVFFDFANLHRPMLFYMYDKDEYQNDLRDFYFDLDELPGPITTKEEDLYKEIKNIDTYWKKYKTKYMKFNEKFNYLDDKNSSKRVIETIIK